MMTKLINLLPVRLREFMVERYYMRFSSIKKGGAV